MENVVGIGEVAEGVEHARAGAHAGALAKSPDQMKKAGGGTAGPRREKRRPIASGHDRLAVVGAGPAGNGYADAIDIQPMQPLEDRFDDAIVGPADEPVRGRAVDEVVLAGPFPDE